MGMFKTSQTVPLWGDKPAEILQEAFKKIEKHFDDLGFKLEKTDLVFGCHCALVSYFPPVKMEVKEDGVFGKILAEADNAPQGTAKK